MPRNELHRPRHRHHPHVDPWRLERRQNLVHNRSAPIPHMAYDTSHARLPWHRQGRWLHHSCVMLEYRMGNANRV